MRAMQAMALLLGVLTSPAVASGQADPAGGSGTSTSSVSGEKAGAKPPEPAAVPPPQAPPPKTPPPKTPPPEARPRTVPKPDVVRRPARSSRRSAPPLAGDLPWDETAWVGPPVEGRGRDPRASRRLRRRRARRAAARRDAGVSSRSPDAGVAAERVVSPPARVMPRPPRPSAPSLRRDGIAAEFDEAFWMVIRTVLGAFLVLRFLAWWVRREARRGRSWADGAVRVWVFVEALAWVLVVVWVSIHVFPDRSAMAAFVGAVVVVTVLATSWSALRDLVTGLILAAERPFDVGDFVRAADVEGQVFAFRARVLELTTTVGEQVRVPYRRIVGTTWVKGGGAQAAHAVRLSFDLPDALTPQEALRTARELAASSPWAVLGVSPRVDITRDGPCQRVLLEAYAFSGAARAELSCDLNSGWKAFVRRAETRTTAPSSRDVRP